MRLMRPSFTSSVPVLFTLAILVGVVAPGRAQEDLTVLKTGADEVPARKVLYAYLQAQAQKHFDARRQAVAALQTGEDVRKRQEELKARFIAALGGFPEKTPLNARVTGKEQRDGYRIERVIYESRPHHHVTAVLFLPEGTPPFPGVLVPCGHSANGKAAETYQRACISMARNGLAVLCYDPIGQGERVQLLDKQGKSAIPGSTSEHTMTGIGALLAGSSTATYRIWDGIRSLDYLASRPEVDPKRLGCTGNSGGGTLTAYLMALDDRIVAAAPSCYITTLERLFATIGPQDAEQNIPGQVAFGLEHTDYVTLRAPRPTLICVGTQDYFDIRGAWTTFREAKLIYGKLGHGERIDLFEYNDKHGFSKPRREAALRWMRRWLLGKDDAVRESDFPIFKDADLQCTRTGQVLEDFKGKSVFDLNAEREQELAPRRAEWQRKHGRDDLAREVRRLIALPETTSGCQVKEVGTIQRQETVVRKLVFEIEPGITLPALVIEPTKAGDRPYLLYVHGQGKALDAAPGGKLEKVALAGHRVVALDLRGMGETDPGNKSAHFGTDSKEAFLAMHLNRPLLGQRVQDVMEVARYLERIQKRPIQAVGVGTAGPVVLHAAALGSSIGEVTIERSVVSWSAVARTPISSNQLSSVVPGALHVYDLPDLAVLVAPRPLTIRDSLDPIGKPISQPDLEAAHATSKRAYLKSPEKLRLEWAPARPAPR